MEVNPAVDVVNTSKRYFKNPLKKSSSKKGNQEEDLYAHFHVGMKVWIKDAKLLWRIGEIISMLVEDKCCQVSVPDHLLEPIQIVPCKDTLSFDPSHVLNHDDIAQMNNLHEAPLLQLLHERYLREEIYTFTADVLLSVNPYKTIPMLYDIQKFMNTNHEHRVPHLFTIAKDAYDAMQSSNLNALGAQSIIVSGESGAGKTEACKYIMKYLAAASKKAYVKHSTDLHALIEECVLQSNFVLEAFGNAKTCRNDNSSRFGKYIQILYNQEGRMVGVTIKHFLLEKTRIVLQDTNERNYHIFYQMLQGLENNQLDKLQLRSCEYYHYLSNDSNILKDEFNDVLYSMDKLGITSIEKDEMFQILAGILHLGNLQFKPDEVDEDASQVDPSYMDMGTLASFFGFDKDVFETKLTQQTTVSGRGSLLIRKLNCQEAMKARDAFCKSIYGEMFNWIVDKINLFSSMNLQKASNAIQTIAVSSFIGILDIFGFEMMDGNGFEQLCINFANEMLQQQFNKHIFVLEQERYKKEGIHVSVVEFADNQMCLDLIQKHPHGLLPLLDQQIMLKRKTNDRQLLGIFDQHHFNKHKSYDKPRFNSDEFMINHYAGQVTYGISGFIEKNTNNLHEDLLSLLTTSELPLLASIFSIQRQLQVVENEYSFEQQPVDLIQSKTPRSNHKRAGSMTRATSQMLGIAMRDSKCKSDYQQQAIAGSITVASTFRNQLNDLMNMLWKTTPHYIKCIKPNNIKFPKGFSCELVRDQLVYSGVLEVVRIRQQGYPVRRPFLAFHNQFKHLVSTQDTILDVCKSIASLLQSDAYQIGRTEVYLRYGQLEILQSMLHDLKNQMAIKIQSVLYRGVKHRYNYQRLRIGIIQLQAIVKCEFIRNKYVSLVHTCIQLQSIHRMKFVYKQYQLQKLSIVKLQALARGVVYRKRLTLKYKQEYSAILIQGSIRKFLSRSKQERETRRANRSAIQIQSRYKSYILQIRYKHLIQSVILIQANIRSTLTRHEYLRGKEATVCSQALIRKAIQRRKYLKQKKMAIKMQSFLRMVNIRKEYVLLQRATIKIQTNFKRYSAQTHYKQCKASMIKIQRIVQVFLTHRRIYGYSTNAIKVQSMIRMHQKYIWYTRIKSKLILIQQTIRQYLQRIRGNALQSTLLNNMHNSDAIFEILYQHESLVFVRFKQLKYKSLLHIAAGKGNIDVVKYLLKRDASLLSSLDTIGNTPLHDACQYGEYDIVKYLANKHNSTIAMNTKDILHVESKLQNAVDVNGVTVYANSLSKRRETSRWMNRWVVLRSNPPALHYYKNRKAASNRVKSDKIMDLRVAMVKKCNTIKHTFEIHSPELLQPRNPQGRLYFKADSEMELQKWLACLRDTIPSSIDSRLFQMHRREAIVYLNLPQRVLFTNQVNKNGNTPLHAVASCMEQLESIKLVLWLLENGASINSMNVKHQTALHVALASNNLQIAKHLLDRGANTIHIDEEYLETIRNLRCHLPNVSESITSPRTGNEKSTSNLIVPLLKQPGIMRNSSYFSTYIEQLGVQSSTEIENPHFIISVYDAKKHLIEPSQQVSILPMKSTNSLFWCFTWYMQTPIENLPPGTVVTFELNSTIQVPVSSESPISPNQIIQTIPQTQPLCWTYLRIDPKTTNTAEFTAEMYLHPVDIKRKRLVRVDAFLQGAISISQGHF